MWCADQASEGLAPAGELAVPGACVHEDLAFECGAHRRGRRPAALVPTAPMGCVPPSFLRSVANALEV